MSNHNVCHECHYENAPGSKFCSNCGARLSESAERICPVCQTPNPQNRYYCDNCGTRLIQDDFAEEAKKPEVPDPSSAGADVFSLPTREPGDTGELDPSDLPEWLRTGTAPLGPDEEDAKPVTGSGKLPNIEGLTPEKKSTADLPEWLVSEFDSEPIIEPPRSISTDHYLDLVNRGEADDLPPVDDDLATGAKLPGWLVDSAGRPEADTSQKDEGKPEAPEAEHAPSPDLPDTAADETAEDEAGEPSASEEETPDWLAELGPLHTDILSSPVDPELASTGGLSLSEEELPDWIDELGPPDTTILSEPLKKLTGLIDEQVVEETDADDWLADFDAVDTQMLSLPAEESYDETEQRPAETDEETLSWPEDFAVPTPQEELPSWLDESDVSEGEPTIPLSPDDTAGADEIIDQDSDAIPAWPVASDAVESLPAEAFPDHIEDAAIPPAEESAELPDWLAEEEDLHPEAAGVEVDEQAGDSEPLSLESEMDVAAWLMDRSDEPLEAEAEAGYAAAEQPAEEALTSEPAEATRELSEWVDELGLPEGVMGPEGDQDEHLPEDLTIGDEELAGWMDELDTAVTGFPVAPSGESIGDSGDLAPFADDVSEWLAEAGESEQEWPPSDALGEVESPDREIEDIDSDSVTAWLADLDDDRRSAEVDESDELARALLQVDETPTETELDWLLPSEELAPEAETAEEEIAPGGEELVQPDVESQEVDNAILADVPDWLGELGSLDLDTSGVEPGPPPGDEVEVPPETEEMAQAIDELAAEGPAAEPIGVEELQVPEAEVPIEQIDDDWLGGDTILDELPEEEELPDWLEQLGPPVPGREIDSQEPEEISSSEDLPEWVANLRPGMDDDAGSLLPTPLAFSADEAAAIDDITDELGAPELPEWLRDDTSSAGGADTGVAPAAAEIDTTGWFRTDEADAFDEAFAFDTDSDMPPDSEWSHLLSELPPAVAPEELLARADIPDWVQKLKPKEMTDAGAELETVRPAVTSGPLTGLVGVVDTESVIAVPRATSPVEKFAVTREQQQQAALLSRIVHWERQPATLKAKKVTATSTAVRIILAFLLFAAILFGIYYPDLLQTEPLTAEPDVLMAAEAVSEAAGKPVVIAVEYTPALAGELTSQMEILLSQVRANGSRIILVSQYAAGVAMARDQMTGQDDTIVRFIPGEAVGLRRFARCIGNEAVCPDMFGQMLESDLQEDLREVGLVLVLTGERDSLVNWIEQVGAATDVKIVAGVTQSLAPVAASYRDGDQLAGLIEGKMGIVAYQNAIAQGEINGEIQQQLGAQHLSQLFVAIVIIAGAIIYGFADRNSNRKDTISSVV